MKKITCITLLLFFTFSLFSQKIKVETAEDLPTHYYNLENSTAMDYIQNETLVIQLANEVEKDLKADLEKYDILDKATLRKYESRLETIALIKKDYEAALNHLKKTRELAEKEVDKYMIGLYDEVYILTKKDKSILNEEEFKKSLGKRLSESLAKMPYEVIKEDVESQVGMLEILNENLYQGVVEGQIQPIIDKSNNQVAQSTVISILSINLTYKMLLPYASEVYFPVYKKLYDANYKEIVLVDIWKQRDVIFEDNESLKPVVIGIWDTGVDMDIFPKSNQWTSTKEKPDGKDNDRNGFIDDIHGIAFKEDGNKEVGDLQDAKKINPDIEEYQKFIKGLGDLQAAVKSEEADDLKKYMSALKPEEVNPFLENLNLYGNYSHGTHVAGIAVKGNPKAEILVVRMTFPYKTNPSPPTLETSKNWSNDFVNIIDFFKENNVRVVNMSWGYSQNGIENSLANNGVGKDAAERKELAKLFFGMQRDSMYNAMKNAPEVLFVTSSGNSNNDVDFANSIPSGLTLPNLMKIGAVDIEGKETGFTTMGKSVDVYGNGYEVESFVPGGTVQKYSGTSMSSPQVVNLAGKIWAKYPTLNVQEVKDLIIKGATNSKHNDEILLINPKQSLKMAEELWAKKH